MRALASIAAVAVGIAAAATTTSSSSGAAATPSLVRVDTVGYVAGEAKSAYLMTHAAVSDATYEVVDGEGDVALSGDVPSHSVGRWNAAYPHVYALDFSAVNASGTYRIEVHGSRGGTSPPFTIVDSRSTLWSPVAADGVAFLQNQRDGADQIAGPLHRQPSHLHDKAAKVYRTPHFAHPHRSDRIRGGLHRVGHRRIDVEGGWFDAGDYLKFTHTAAYADVLLEASQRALGEGAPPVLVNEARYGERWLAKMWDPTRKTLYLQVGIGSGNNHSFYGDHDLWRLPQSDDTDHKVKHRFAAAHRPVFRAAAPGHRISPNLGGRVSAAFALAAQNDAATSPTRARHLLATAMAIYELAKTHHPPHPLVTAEPVGYYPEDSWHDDMALGAVEIAWAKVDLGDQGARYARDAGQWVKTYIAHDESSETFNLYDTSALAEFDLAQLYQAHPLHHQPISRSAVLHGLKRPIDRAANRAGNDPFRAGGFYDEFDVDSHTFGLVASAAMYDGATGSPMYRAFATEQRDWLFGANAWGASFMVGEGLHFPRCMQHQVANLSGSRDGTAPLDAGAVVNGPNDKAVFEGGLGSLQDGVRRCPADRSDAYRQFTGHGSRYLDDTRSWQTSEPAIDMTATAVLAAALQISQDLPDKSDTLSTRPRVVTLLGT